MATRDDRSPVRIALATPEDREAIYRLRHDVYARELHQHPENAECRLTDAIDAFNECFAATIDGKLVGCISVTPPGHEKYSIDRYLSRDELPFPCDEKLYEVRLFTVDSRHRGSSLAALLMYTALRWVESQGGLRIIAIGRREILGLYRRAGLRPLGRRIQSGAVQFELMTATIDELREGFPQFRRLIEKLEVSVDWHLPIPFLTPARCEHGGAFWDAIGDELQTLERSNSVINADVLDAWFPPAPKVMAAIEEHLAWIIRTSPPAGCEGMIRVIAQTRGIDSRCVLPGDGSSPLIFLAFREWLRPASRTLILDPTYGEYAHVLERVVRCKVDRLELSPDDGYRLDPSRLAERLEQRYDFVVLVNPNSPTGRHVPRAELEAVLSESPASTRIWIDETYVDYAGPDESLERFAAASENVIVTKSMSKVYALSGLRAAYLCAAPRIVEELKAFTPPWAVSLPAQVAAIAALRDTGYYAARWAETHALRAELAEALSTRLGLEIVPGVANFILCRLPPGGPDAATVCERCRTRGLYIRDASGMSPRLGSHAIRIAVKDRATNRKIVEILGETIPVPRSQ